MKKSVWVDTCTIPTFESLEGDKKCDVLIIGGGMAGLMCAYKLHNLGVDYILVEGDRIAKGITKNTTAKITSAHGIIYSNLVSAYGKEKAQMYLTANENAVKEYEKITGGIDCDFEKRSAYTYSVKDRRMIERETETVNNLGVRAEFVRKTELPFEIMGAVKFANQAQFNPLKFISAIARDMNIYENTFVEDIQGTTAITTKGKIKAEKIIVTTHFPFINRHGSYFLKLYQHRSYVSGFENIPLLKGMYVDSDKKGMSFRSYKNLLLVGGGGHRTGKKGEDWEVINKRVKEWYPTARIKYTWATQDCMSLDLMPYIGKYSKNMPEVYVATGFNKWGMTSSLIASEILADLVRGKRSEYKDLFSPQRGILKPRLFVNGFEAAFNLVTPAKKRCPHMGCALKWNEVEHTWDCPCHGSRFEKDGRLIDNPAKKDLQ